MATTNAERTQRMMELLQQGLKPYIERELRAAHLGQPSDHDVQGLLKTIRDEWATIFDRKLPKAARNYVFELLEFRNDWAHQRTLTGQSVARALETASFLLNAVSAGEQAAELDKLRQDLLRTQFTEQARQVTRRVAEAPTEGTPVSGLTPWRDVVTPHQDVAQGTYQQAEFAADLSQVLRGEASAEYQQPREFFRRTFLTDSLHKLLVGALQRLSGSGGDPVVELQTNFGGGKTHSMLALYHLFSGADTSHLLGVDSLIQEAGASPPSKVHRAVLVGTTLAPGQPHRKPDGTVVRTLWGELAWQLGGKDGYDLVAESDQNGTNPGEHLKDLFEFFSPALILIDEWVAYVRQLADVADLPAGSYEANMTFAQALTEQVKATKNVLLVTALPASDIEVGGPAGQAALKRLQTIVGRANVNWRPATAEEGFEIVRRRLFQDIDPDKARLRDAVVQTFAKLYRQQQADFPSRITQGNYEQRLAAAYPIHPELFDQLYGVWSTIDRFQRTRGVLRFMAAVIHSLWEKQDHSLLILPAMVPLEDQSVHNVLMRFLEENWPPVMDTEIDGPASLPLRIDRENPTLQRYSATRRVARTVFLGTAPSKGAANRGVDDRTIKLGCVQPGESAATFGDALRHLTNQATHLYADNGQYWYDTQPNVTRTALDLAARLDRYVIEEEIVRRVQQDARNRGDFLKVYACPSSPADVPDEPGAHLVILGPTQTHANNQTDSKAREAAMTLLTERSGGPRRFRNALVFLAPDATRITELETAVRSFLAWQLIHREAEARELTPSQTRQAETKKNELDRTVNARLPEAYRWILDPYLEKTPGSPIVLQQTQISGSGISNQQESLAARASRKLRSEERLIGELSAETLRHHLDGVPLWPEDGDHLTTQDLWDYLNTYLYLPRLCNVDVLITSIRNAPRLTWATDTFAYADGYDEATGRYRGLRGAEGGSIVISTTTYLVKPESAQRQMDGDRVRVVAEPGPVVSYPIGGGSVTTTPQPPIAEPAAPRPYRRFHGSVELNPLRASAESDRIASAVIQHLAGLLGADVRITLEIEADVPEGVPENVIRTVTENCNVLHFSSASFEHD